MSLIDDRFECPTCGGYRLPFRSGLSSVCACPDYHPVEPSRHQIGARLGQRAAGQPSTIIGGDQQ